MKSINSTLLHSGRTSIFIAHRLRTVVEAGKSVPVDKFYGADFNKHRPDHSAQGRSNHRGRHTRGAAAFGSTVPWHVSQTVSIGMVPPTAPPLFHYHHNVRIMDKWVTSRALENHIIIDSESPYSEPRNYCTRTQDHLHCTTLLIPRVVSSVSAGNLPVCFFFFFCFTSS